MSDWRIGIAIAIALLGCKEKATPDNLDIEDVEADAAVEWARKELANIETQLASQDPGRASSGCAVIEPDLPKIRKRDPKLADKLEQRCGKDLHLRSLTVFVEKTEKARAADPTGRLSECWSLDIYAKHVEPGPERTKLEQRHAAVCPKQP